MFLKIYFDKAQYCIPNYHNVEGSSLLHLYSRVEIFWQLVQNLIFVALYWSNEWNESLVSCLLLRCDLIRTLSLQEFQSQRLLGGAPKETFWLSIRNRKTWKNSTQVITAFNFHRLNYPLCNVVHRFELSRQRFDCGCKKLPKITWTFPIKRKWWIRIISIENRSIVQTNDNLYLMY